MNGETPCCVICGSDRPAAVGYLCRGHLERLGAMLRDIEDEAALLSAVPSFQQRGDSRSGAPAFTRAPARIDVLVHTDPRHGTGKSEDEDDELVAGETLSILSTLHSWARVVREDRALSEPEQITISGERDLLSRQLEWVAAQLWVDEAYGDIRQLLSQLRTANGTGNPRPVARCTQCDGNVWRRDTWRTVWRVRADRCERESIAAPDGPAYCEKCGAHWDAAGEIDRLELIEEQRQREAKRPKTSDGRRMLTGEELAAQLGTTIGNVRVKAHRLGIFSVNGHYDPELFSAKATA